MFVGALHRPLRRQTALALALILSLIGGACGGGAATSASGRTSLSVGLGYIPSVQFAPFYLADQRGDYSAAGLDVTIQNQIDPDLISLVGTGSVDLALADGTSVIPAVSQGIPIRYIATIYGTLPNVVIARTDAGIAKPSDLRGKRIGTPGRYGSGYLTLLGIIADAGVNESDLSIELFPDFGQTQALINGSVDAVTGYANNDLVLAQESGIEVEVFYASAAAPFAGPGLISSPNTITVYMARVPALWRFVSREEARHAREQRRGRARRVGEGRLLLHRCGRPPARHGRWTRGHLRHRGRLGHRAQCRRDDADSGGEHHRREARADGERQQRDAR